MRKVVSVLLSAAMALSLCAGCSSSSSDTADTKAAEKKGADAADTEAGEAAEGVMPAVAKEDLKVGVIHIGNPADGSGYSYTLIMRIALTGTIRRMVPVTAIRMIRVS